MLQCCQISMKTTISMINVVKIPLMLINFVKHQVMAGVDCIILYGTGVLNKLASECI